MPRYRFIIKNVLSVLSDVSYFVYPGQCPVCEKRIDTGYVCRECTKKIFSSFSISRFNKKADFIHIEDKIAFSECICGWEYSNDIKNLISLMKYKGFESLCIWIGRIIGRKIKGIIPYDSIIVPVPLHPARKRERGYNQSELITSGILKEISYLSKGDFLIRIKNTRPQASLDGEQRQENVRGAFKIKDSAMLKRKTVILIDDVITTGATINNCAVTLMEHGADEVKGVSIARPCVVK